MDRVGLRDLKLTLSACIVCFAHVHVWADEPDGEQAVQKKIADHWIEVSRDYAQGYRIAPRNQPKEFFELYKHPVFQHIQTVRGNDIGAVHLWVDADGRPAAIATVFGWTINETYAIPHAVER